IAQCLHLFAGKEALSDAARVGGEPGNERAGAEPLRPHRERERASEEGEFQVDGRRRGTCLLSRGDVLLNAIRGDRDRLRAGPEVVEQVAQRVLHGGAGPPRVHRVVRAQHVAQLGEGQLALIRDYLAMQGSGDWVNVTVVVISPASASLARRPFAIALSSCTSVPVVNRGAGCRDSVGCRQRRTVAGAGGGGE